MWESAPYQADSELLSELWKRSTPISKTKGSVLFYQGQKADGIYVVLTGQVRLSLITTRGKVLVPRFAGPDSVLGLPAIVSNQPYSLKAEMAEDSTLGYVSREKLVDLMRSSTALSIRVIEMLGRELGQMREVLATTA